MHEQKGRIVQAHWMDTVVRTLDLTHLLQLVCLTVTQKLPQSLEKLLITLYLLHYSCKKDWIFERNKFLEDEESTKGVEHALGNVSKFEHQHGEVLLEVWFEHLLPFFLFRTLYQL